MHKLISTIFILFSPVFLFAKEGVGIDDKINDFMTPLTDFIERIIFASFQLNIVGEEVAIPFVLVWLISGALLFTFYFNFLTLGDLS